MIFKTCGRDKPYLSEPYTAAAWSRRREIWEQAAAAKFYNIYSAAWGKFLVLNSYSKVVI